MPTPDFPPKGRISGPRFSCLACGVGGAGEPPPICAACGVVGAFSFGEAPAGAAPPGSLAEKATALVVLRTGIRAVDGLLGGFPRGTATTLYGGPGSGKSTLALGMAAGLSRALEGPVLCVCPEMSREILEVTARVLVPAGELGRLFPAKDPEAWATEARERAARVLVVDSVSRMRDPVATMAGAVAWAHAGRGVAILLAHLAKDGSPAGAVRLEHDPDAVLFMSADGEARTLEVEKCRWHPVGKARIS